MKMITPIAHPLHEQQQTSSGYIKMRSAATLVNKDSENSHKLN